MAFVSLTGEKFNHWTIIEELGGGKVLCECDCDKHTRKVLDKYSVKKGKSSSCGCTKSYEKYKGKQFNDWYVIDDIDNKKALCQCLICDEIYEVKREHLKNGASKRCIKCSHSIIKDDTVGETFNYLTVVDELGKGKIRCRCVCNNVKIYNKYQVKNGFVKSCGCKSTELKVEANFINRETQRFNQWVILNELGNGKVEAKCDCGNIKVVSKTNIVNGLSKSCGHKYQLNNLKGEVINNWKVIEELGHGYVRCKCKCGNINIIQKPTLLDGRSKSCGCKQYDNFKDTCMRLYGEVTANKISNPREAWQIEIVHDREKFIKFVQTNFSYKPTIYQLVDNLGINASSVGRCIKELDISEYVDIKPLHSRYETEILSYIKEIYSGEVIHGDRVILNGRELDIYIPEKKIAIEFNGTYWHSTVFKDRKYHQQKTIDCAKRGIRLIHIFEYEWVELEKQDKLKRLLKTSILGNKSVKYARQLKVCDISNVQAYEFLDKYHLQNHSNSTVNIGLIEEDSIIGVLTLGKPRFNNDFTYEIHRLAFKDNTTVVGGIEKLFKYFIDTYSPDSIVTYSDISKFTGNSYLKLGFKVDDITEPNYIWTNPYTGVTYSRYQTQKHKLLEKGFGTEEQTEDEIMYNMNFFKIYDSGNIKLEWRQ